MMAFTAIEDSGAIRSVSFLWQHGVHYELFSFLSEAKESWQNSLMEYPGKKRYTPIAACFSLPRAEFGW